MSTRHPWAGAPDTHSSDYEVIRWTVGSLLPGLRKEWGPVTPQELMTAAGTDVISELAALRLRKSLLFRVIAEVDLKGRLISFDDIRFRTVLDRVRETENGGYCHPSGRIGRPWPFGIRIRA